MITKGVSTDRSKNWRNMDYVIHRDFEGLGLTMFIHKYFLGMSHLYMLDSY